MATSIYRYMYIDISSCKIGIFENSRYHPFYLEGSPLLHPVASLSTVNISILLNLKCLIFVESDRIHLDFYIYQVFNIHTERLLDTVVPLNILM